MTCTEGVRPGTPLARQLHPQASVVGLCPVALALRGAVLRWIGWILLALVIAAWVSSELPLAEAELGPPCHDPWRKTADGWEPQQVVLGHALADRPALHPAVVAALQVLLAVYCLVGLEPKAKDLKPTTPSGLRS